jgi:hypothetical protein
MTTPFEFSNAKDDRIVYVRSVALADLPKEMQEQVSGMEQLYAVHAENGERLAVVADRDLAFTLARQNDFAPVTVH